MKKLAKKIVASLIGFSLILAQSGIVEASNNARITLQGWKQNGATWNYLKADGTNTIGWLLSNNKWYYLDSNGTMITGWKQEGAKWYYLNPNGDMAVSITTPDGYVVGADGTWDGLGAQLSAKDINNKYSNSIVYIEAEDSKHNLIGSASGFIINANGTIITNFSVIKGCQYANVILKDGTKYQVKSVLNYNEKQDIAVLQLSNAANLSTVKLGDSNTIETGDNVVSIGSAKGYEDTLITGIINGVNRKNSRGSDFQTTASSTHVSSGGALFDMRGDVIGLSYAEDDSLGNMGAIIPINEVKPFLSNSNEMTLMQINNIPVDTVKFFPALSDVPMPKYGNYYKVSLALKDNGTYTYCYYYSGATMFNNFFTEYYSLLQKNGWVVYTGTDYVFGTSFVAFSKGANIISVGLSGGNANIIGYINK